MSTAEQPLVYVFTPVYNGEKYLAECIESVLGQTYQAWQYYILNNRSTDRSRHIAEDYAKNDRRLRVLDTPQFLNHLANQNLGLRQMPPGAVYCKIVHADDWVYPECIAKMVELAEANPKVLLVGSYGLRQDRVAWDGVPYTTSVIDGRELCRRTLLGGPYLFGSPTSLLIRADEVRKRPEFFNEANPQADKEICFDILRNGDFGFVHQVLTFTREHEEADPSGTRDLHSSRPGDLTILMRYGSEFLSPAEFTACEKRQWKGYYIMLGNLVFQNKAPNFWQYHISTLKSVGCHLNWLRVAAAAFMGFLDLALNPLNTTKRIARKIKAIVI
jgi:glycosyltransferase involved in cell wall biosynthesis